MRAKWHFRKESTLEFSEEPLFYTKSYWNLPKGRAHLKVFLSKVEKELFAAIGRLIIRHSTLPVEEWK